MVDKKPLSIEEFITTSKRNYSAKQTQTNRLLRFNEEINLINKHTELFVLGKIPDGNFLTLQDIKNYLSQIPNNPFEMVHGEANAKICSDLHRICIKGVLIDGKKQQCVAKSLGINRVGYFNLQFAKFLLAKTTDNQLKQTIANRIKAIENLPNREGYNSL